MRALVTGATRGLGKGLVEHLARSGWEVAAIGRDADRLNALLVGWGIAVTALVADVTDPAGLAAAVSAAGPFDLVVANAGALVATGPFWEADLDEWLAGVDVNLNGVAATMHAALPAMVAAGSGRIIVMGSGMGHRPTPWVSQYSVSKAAAARLVESVEQELQGTGVHCFLVSPGTVRTDMTTHWSDDVVEHYPHLGHLADDEWTPPERFFGLVDRIATGELDDLAGHFVHVEDDLQVLQKAIADDDRVRTLRQVAAFDDDPTG